MSTQNIQLRVPLHFNQLLEVVKQLSTREKLLLSSALWDDTPENEIDIPEEHKKIVQQRLRKMEEKPDDCLTREDIENKIKL